MSNVGNILVWLLMLAEDAMRKHTVSTQGAYG